MATAKRIQCKVCLQEISVEKMPEHMAAAHAIKTKWALPATTSMPLPASFAGTTSRSASTARYGSPDRLTSKSTKAKLDVHQPGTEKKKAKEVPLGSQVLAGLKEGVRWTATESESCGTCRRRIVFLDVSGDKQKAFDVDKARFILGLHLCAETTGGGSIFAYSGGAIDSNRRRH